MNRDEARPASPGGRAVLRRHGRSFHFAGRFLHGGDLERCAALYAFCRHVDDLVDHSASREEARAGIRRIRSDLARESSREPVVGEFIRLSRAHGLSPEVTEALLDGMESDLETVRMADIAQLLRYCHRAAGTVGLHMSRLLRAADSRAAPHAVDLGVAMQLTNIARDVVEDARRGRIYLPRELTGDLAPAEILAGPAAAGSRVVPAVARILSLADAYYQSGEAGLVHLPRRAHLGILVAARVYREIGRVLAARGHLVWDGRAIVTGRRKLRLAFDAWRYWRSGRSVIAPVHDRSLHAALVDLPGSNP